MGRAVVHFEIVGNDADALRAYYGELFGWEYDVQQPFDYGLVDKESVTNSDGVGIGGGVGNSGGHGSQVTFYVEVPDVEAALAQAEALGGSRIMGPETLMPGVTLGQLRDPQGNVIGVLQAMP